MAIKIRVIFKYLCGKKHHNLCISLLSNQERIVNLQYKQYLSTELKKLSYDQVTSYRQPW